MDSPGPGEGNVKQRHTVLIVDDDEGLNTLLQKTLRKEGFLAEGVTTGAHAVERSLALHNVFLILDYRLPDLSGKEVIQMLHEKNHFVPFMVMTGHGDERTAVEMMKMGARDYITKNDSFLSLLKVLPHILTRIFIEIEKEQKLLVAEKALQESEERYRRISETVTDYIYTVYVDQGRPVKTMHSEACYAVTGYTSKEFEADPYLWIRMVHEEDHDALRGQIAVAFSGKTPPPLEHRIVRKDGTTVWVESTIAPTLGTEGELQTYDGIIRDITERKLAEAALRESEEKYRNLFENAVDPIFIINAEYNYIDVNRKAIEVFGYSKEEFLKMNLFDVIPPSQRENSEKELEKLNRNGYYENFVGKMLTRDGRWLDIEVSSSAIMKDGRVIGSRDIVRNITDRTHMEMELRKFKRAVEQSQVSIIITDTSGAIEYVNPYFTELTGYTYDEVVGQNPRILRSDTDYPPDHYKKLWSTLTSGKVWRGEFRNRKKNGDIYWEDASISPLTNEKGVITHYIAIKEDITERRNLERQLRQAQKMEAVGQLAGGIAHDFNNILSAIINYAYLLNKKVNDDISAGEIIEQILSLAGRGAEITQGLLTFSRQHIINRIGLSINQSVKNIEKLLLKFIGEDIQLKIHLDDDVPSIMADSAQIEQVIMNLVTNAEDAMPEGGTLTLTTERSELDAAFVNMHGLARPGAYALLTISDTGTGISDTIKEKIYEPFFTTKEVGQGTGLGLSIVYGIVKQHDGYILLETEESGGTTFRIYFPAVDAEVLERKEFPRSDLVGHGELILVAEDEEEVRTSMKTILEESNYRVVEAVDGREAVEKFIQYMNDIDMLVLDVIMPDMNGKAAYDAIKKYDPAAKVIFTSGYTREGIGKKEPALSGLNYISKPVAPDMLLKEIREVLAAEKRES